MKNAEDVYMELFVKRKYGMVRFLCLSAYRSPVIPQTLVQKLARTAVEKAFEASTKTLST